MATNTSRIEHKVDLKDNTFRSKYLKQILNDIDEELFDRGYVEVSRSGVFITQINVWNTSAKIIKRAQVDITRTTPPFIDQVDVIVYEETLGLAVISTTTTTIVRDGNNQITSIDTQTVRT